MMSEDRTTIAFSWDCEMGCPPVHMEVPVLGEMRGDSTIILRISDHGSRLIRMAVVAHMAGVHRGELGEAS